MYYTKEDAEKATKVLFFEGAGCVELGGGRISRIRTAFTNDEGKKIYLEIMGIDVTEKSPQMYKKFKTVGFIDFCHYADPIVLDGWKEYENVKEVMRGTSIEYSKAEILKFVNENLNCSFDDIKILDTFDGYRVHKGNREYNFIEDYTYKPEIAAARRNAYNKIDMQIREQLCAKYSSISLQHMDDESITVRIYANDRIMQAHGMDPKQREITVQL